jgi:hypothetical protein
MLKELTISSDEKVIVLFCRQIIYATMIK